MDPITHGLVGACASQLVSPRSHLKIAAGVGFVTALLPDLDVLLKSSQDPLFQLELHRQFSHSLAFTPLGALAASGFFWYFLKERLSFSQLYLMCLSAYATAGLLDACTSYGTQLLWPFSTNRFAWNLTPVVEPFLTIPLLLLVSLSLRRKQRRWPILAGLWLTAFLFNGGIQQKKALQAADNLANSRGHRVKSFVVKPTLGNQILWRVNYIYGDKVYTDGVRTSLFHSSKVYVGESVDLVEIEKEFAHLQGTPLFQSLLRFSRLSDGYLVRHAEEKHVIGDARYSMLPTSLQPLWGLQFDPEKPDKAPTFLTFRDSSRKFRVKFWNMLKG